ncbi:MAG: DUF5995 family protein [Deltaproteobacteria bacterium]|nr:DUF5995 family protein [Deltaproteobacteria bacterium]
MPSNDLKLAEIVASMSPTSVADAISLLRALDGELSSDDGLKWFNLLYLIVTEEVRDQSAVVQWENPKWLERLDVIFAGLYFAALSDWFHSRDRAARCWSPLFESRDKPGILRVQFAFAGINAHINHDLAVALVSTGKELRRVPRRGSREYRDFDKVNGILEVAQEKARQFITTGIVGLIDESLGSVDDMLAGWSIRKARETAWTNAEILWRLNRAPAIRNEFLINLDRLVALSSRGILIPVAKN